MSTTFACETCFDTFTIDQGGREVVCPDCVADVVIKLTGLAHGLGEMGKHYRTAVAWTSSTITFQSRYASEIRNDVAHVRSLAVNEARLAGHRGRNYISSGAFAIERRVIDALNNRKENQP